MILIENFLLFDKTIFSFIILKIHATFIIMGQRAKPFPTLLITN